GGGGSIFQAGFAVCDVRAHRRAAGATRSRTGGWSVRVGECVTAREGGEHTQAATRCEAPLEGRRKANDTARDPPKQTPNRLQPNRLETRDPQTARLLASRVDKTSSQPQDDPPRHGWSGYGSQDYVRNRFLFWWCAQPGRAASDRDSLRDPRQ
ncbi:hypothetical protein T484DRAFT_1888758, partial [Baffinella frigidus]